MRLFLDTANLDETASGNAWGVADGVTAHPSWTAIEGRQTAEQIRAICDIGDGPVSAEQAAEAGANAATMPFQVPDWLFNRLPTDRGLEQFLQDYARVFPTAKE